MNQENHTPATAGSPRKAWVDLGKGISMLMVVLFHCETYNPAGPEGCSALFAFFRMPFFFFLSGYVFTRNYRAFSLRAKMKQIARGLVWTYLVFTSIILIPKALMNGSPIAEGVWLILTGRASWFVVSLGGAQVLFAFLLRFTQKLPAVLAFMCGSLCAGYVVKALHPDMLPFCFDCTLLVVFFFGLGFFYRIYEDRISNLLPASWPFLALATLLYFGAILADARFFHTPPYLFGVSEYQNFPLYILYALLGIVMMTLLTKLLPGPGVLGFIGRNSLVFYYLNGGTARIAYALGEKTGLYRAAAGPAAAGTAAAMLISCLCLSAAAILIKRYCPILAGDRQAFNRLMRKLNWKIEF